MAETGNLGQFRFANHNGTVYAPKQCLYQKVPMGMQSLKIQSLCRCNKHTGHYGLANFTRFYAPTYMDENGNLGKFGAADHNGTVFAPKQCLYQKVALGMKSLKI